jgi:hypothetical protein
MSRRRAGEAGMVQTWVPPRWRSWLIGAAAIYLLALAISTSEVNLFDRLEPGTLRFFTQLSALFVKAADTTIDYRLEGYSCDESRFEEIDTSRYFQMRPNDKENRFQRLAHFYRSDAKVMAALEEFLLPKLPRKTGGIRLLSLRIPFGPPGEGIERYQRKPLVEYSADIRHVWYATPMRERVERCAEAARP